MSLSRLFLLPFILIFLFHENFQFSFFTFHFSIPGDSLSLFLMILCVITDGLDGIIARRRNQVTEIGKILDHLIDKILTITIILSLIPLRDFPLWIALLILFRDIVILIGSFILFKGKRIVSTSSSIGKLTGFSFALMVIAYVLQMETLSKFTTGSSVILVFLSGFHYLYLFFKHFRSPHEMAPVSTPH